MNVLVQLHIRARGHIHLQSHILPSPYLTPLYLHVYLFVCHSENKMVYKPSNVNVAILTIFQHKTVSHK